MAFRLASKIHHALHSFVLIDKRRLSTLENSTVLPLPPASASSSSEFIVARSRPEGGRSLEYIAVSRSAPVEGASAVAVRSLFEVNAGGADRPRVTCIVKLDRERALLGYSELVFVAVSCFYPS